MILHRLPDSREVWCLPGSVHEIALIYREIFIDKVYESHLPPIRPHDIIIDAGANVGLFALSALARQIPLTLYCVEPVGAIRECLVENLSGAMRHQGSSVHVIDCALGANDGPGSIEFIPHAPGNSTQHFGRKMEEIEAVMNGLSLSSQQRVWFRSLFRNSARLDCKVKRLSTLIRESSIPRIDLLKLDVEGAEIEVLNGLENSHLALIQSIVMECADWNRQELPLLRQRLSLHGFGHILIVDHPLATSRESRGLPGLLYATRLGAQCH